MMSYRWLFAISLATPALAGTQDLLVSSRFSNNILRYDASSGEFLGVFAEGPELINPNGIAYGPDGHLYVGLGDGTAILRYDGQSGAFMDSFTEPGAGGLSSVRDIEFGPDGDLYVASAGSASVLRFDGSSGAFVSTAAQGNGMSGPVGLAFSPSRELLVGAALSNQVYVWDDGAFVRSFNAGGTHSNATGLAFSAAGDLLVAQSVTNELLAFDEQQGAFLDVFADEGVTIPIYMELAPTGELIVGSFGDNSVARFDALTGAYLGKLVESGSGGLSGTHDFAFMPVPEPGSAWLLVGALGALRLRRSRFAA